MTIEFELDGEELKGYVINKEGEKIPFTGHKFCDLTGEGVTQEMLAAFRYGRKLGRQGAAKALHKKLKEIIEQD